jgi:hypothetical protein
VAVSLAIGVSGAAGLSLLSSTMNDWHSTAFVIAGLYLALRGKHLAWAGVLMGFAAGLKLAYAPFGVALVAAMLVHGTARERWRRAARVAVFVGLGWLATGGAWSAFLWVQYGDPLFPYFNSIFRSAEWLPQSYRDTRFGARSAMQWLAFPLYFSRGDFRLVSEVSFRDYRMAMLWVLGVTALLWLLLAGKRRERLPREWRLLAVFTVVAYVAWLVVFSYYRYALPFEVLCGLFVCGAVLWAFRARPPLASPAMVVLGVLLVVSTHKMGWERVAFGERFFEVGVPATEPGALVVLSGNHPMAYTIPFYNRDARFVSMQNNLITLGQESLMARRAEAVVRTHDGPLYLLEREGGWPESPLLLRHFALERERCEPIRSNLEAGYALQHCKLRRVSPRG